MKDAASLAPRGRLKKPIEKEKPYIIEIWEMKNYFVLPRRVLISFRHYFLFTRNDSVLSTNEYWKEIPLKEEKLCVISSPSDNYRWTARQCNGPDVASFICEMPSKEFFPSLFSYFRCYLSFGPFQRLKKKIIFFLLLNRNFHFHFSSKMGSEIGLPWFVKSDHYSYIPSGEKHDQGRKSLSKYWCEIYRMSWSSKYFESF